MAPLLAPNSRAPFPCTASCTSRGALGPASCFCSPPRLEQVPKLYLACAFEVLATERRAC